VDRDRVDELLCNLLRAGSEEKGAAWIRALPAGEWDAVVRRARVHKVSPLLYSRLRPFLRGSGVPESAADGLRGDYLSNVARNTRLFHEFGRLLDRLNRQGIRVVVLKGGHLAEAVYENIGQRSMTDLDILVRKQDLERVLQCVEDEGLFFPGTPLNVDVQTCISHCIADLAVPEEELLERATSLIIAGNEVRGFCPEDLLLHLVIHLAVFDLYGISGLRGLCDIRETIQHFRGGLDWETIAARAAAWGVRNAVRLSLALARELLGALVPEDVPEGLDPSGVDPAAKAWAQEQIFGEKLDGRLLSPFFWDLWRGDSSRGRFRTLKSLFFPPIESLSAQYRGRYGSRRSSFYYLVRMRDHAALYTGAVRRILTGDREMIARLKNVKKDMTMQEWLVSG